MVSEPDQRVVARHKWLALCIGYWDEPYVSTTDGVIIVPVNEQGEVLFIVEPSVVDAHPVLSLPAGVIEESEPMAESANRELQEEAGYKAGRMEWLAAVDPLARHARWKMHLFLARDLTPARLPGDEQFEIRVERVPLAEFESLIDSGRLTYAPVIAALYMARRVILREAGQ
ncbi:MAG: NUDIX domain-containing protein [Chloroflexi bacterium]|nr:NUDIX domain-containing protein [Chloroflexota bacterium]